MAFVVQDMDCVFSAIALSLRFLKLDQSTGKWIEVSNEYAYMQVLQMFIRQQQEDKPGRGRQQEAAASGDGDVDDRKPSASEGNSGDGSQNQPLDG